MSNEIRTKVSRGTLSSTPIIEAQTEKIEMTLNTDSAVASGLLIQRLTELYENPIEATVRETVSNGLDAIAESVQKEEGELYIYKPTRINPVFSVRDNGVGMSHEDLVNVYSKYGASTKQNNFDQIGAYGLGAKAPLAYGTEFTVSSVKNGVKTTIIVVREELTNYIKIVSSVETDEPSGTTVSVPVQSGDISQFCSFVDKYVESPADYNAKLFIDDELVTSNKWELLSDDVVLFGSGSEAVKGRIWITTDENEVSNLICRDDIKHEVENMRLVIGGWTYSTPVSRQGYYQRTSRLCVELKPGLVAFNSSRDAVLQNERYNDFVEKIQNYLISNSFAQSVSKIVNTKDIESFKKILFTALTYISRSIKVKGSEVKFVNNSTQNKNLLNLNNLKHEETGYSLQTFTKDVPDGLKKTASYSEHKQQTYSSTRTNYRFISSVKDNDNWYSYSSNSVRSMNVATMLNEVFSEDRSPLALGGFVVDTLINKSQSRYDNVIFFVTDISTRDESIELIKKRRSIASYALHLSDKEVAPVQVLYTEYTKSEIEKMLQTAGIGAFVRTQEETLKEIKSYRKKHSDKTTRVVNKNFQPLLTRYEKEDSLRVKIEEIDQTKSNIIVISKESYISVSTATMIKNWYCNENKITKPDDVVLYNSRGEHRVSDLNILEGIENLEIYTYKYSKYAGKSNTFIEKYQDKHPGEHVVLMGSKDKEFEHVFRLLSSVHDELPSRIIETIKSQVVNLQEISTLIGVDMEEVDVAKLIELKKRLEKEYGTQRYGVNWLLSEESEDQLISTLSDETKNILIDVSLLSSELKAKILKLENDKLIKKDILNIPIPCVEEVKSMLEVKDSYSYVEMQIKVLAEKVKVAQQVLKYLYSV